VRDEHQLRKDGKRMPRMWRRASVASDQPPPSETVQTDCSTVTQGDLSQISDQFIKPCSTPLVGRSVGKTSESSETARAKSEIGSGADAFDDDDDPSWGTPG